MRLFRKKEKQPKPDLGYRASAVADGTLLYNAGQKVASNPLVYTGNPYVLARAAGDTTSELAAIAGHHKGIKSMNEGKSYRDARYDATSRAGHIGGVANAIKASTIRLPDNLIEVAGIGATIGGGRRFFKELAKENPGSLKGIGKAAGRSALKGAGVGLLSAPITVPLKGYFAGKDAARAKARLAFDHSVKTSGDISKAKMGRYHHDENDYLLGAAGTYGLYRTAKYGGKSPLGIGITAGSAGIYGLKRYYDHKAARKLLDRGRIADEEVPVNNVQQQQPEKLKESKEALADNLVTGGIIGGGIGAVKVLPGAIKGYNKAQDKAGKLDFDLKYNRHGHRNNLAFKAEQEAFMDAQMKGKTAREAIEAKRNAYDTAIKTVENNNQARRDKIQKLLKKAKRGRNLKIIGGTALGVGAGLGVGYGIHKVDEKIRNMDSESKRGVANGTKAGIIGGLGTTAATYGLAKGTRALLSGNPTRKAFRKTKLGKTILGLGTAGTILSTASGAATGGLYGVAKDTERKINKKYRKKKDDTNKEK